MVSPPKYLADTDWAVYYLRGREPYVTRLREYRAEGLGISTISLAELYEGVFRSPRRHERERHLEDFLAGLTVIDVTRDVACTFGRLRAELRGQGVTVPDLDLLIGSTAVCHDLVLLTDNRRHYDKVPGIRLVEQAGEFQNTH